MLRKAIGIVWIAAVCGMAVAQEPPADKPQEKDPAVLRGPKVEEGAAAKSLVQRDYQGKLVRLEVDPAQAALDLIKLEDKDRAAAQEIVLARDAMIDKLVFDNLRTIAELAQARQSGDTETSSRLVKELWDKSADWRARGRLVDELTRVLPDEQGQQMRDLVNEYVRAALAERKAQDPEKEGGAGGAGVRAVVAEGLEGFGREIRRSYERVFASQAKDFDELIKKLQLTPEQESRVRQLVGDLFQKTYGKPTKAQTAKVFLQVYGVLDPEQRRALAQMIGQERRDELRARNAGPGADKPSEMPAP